MARRGNLEPLPWRGAAVARRRGNLENPLPPQILPWTVFYGLSHIFARAPPFLIKSLAQPFTYPIRGLDHPRSLTGSLIRAWGGSTWRGCFGVQQVGWDRAHSAAGAQAGHLVWAPPTHLSQFTRMGLGPLRAGAAHAAQAWGCVGAAHTHMKGDCVALVRFSVLGEGHTESSLATGSRSKGTKRAGGCRGAPSCTSLGG